ncbi:MAG: hypothetical protein ACYC35_13125 [Pirellulales bacterium]
MAEKTDKADKTDKFDRYREALVVETETVWPDALSAVGPTERERIETRLKAEPEKAAHIRYVRLSTGFCRRITVTPEDIERVK